MSLWPWSRFLLPGSPADLRWMGWGFTGPRGVVVGMGEDAGDQGGGGE